jgi:hypothetical protein
LIGRTRCVDFAIVYAHVARLSHPSFELSMPDKKREFNNAVHKDLGRRKS